MRNEICLKMISKEDIIKSGCFDITHVMSVIEKVLTDYKNGSILLPDKISQIFNEETQDRINCMPSTLLKERVCGVKWVSVFPDNPVKYGVPNVSGIIILSEIDKGFPFAVMDGGFLTAVRTACMGALGAKYLARKDSEIYGTIGTGEQAKMHFIAIKTVFPAIRRCCVSSRTPEEEQSFIKEMSSKFPDVEYIPCNTDCDKAAENADIIVTAVSCQQPLLKASAVKRGAFYCHVGGLEDEYDVPRKADKIVCDDWKSLKHRGSPTIARMFTQGLLNDDDIYGNLADIIDGTKPGRENDDEFLYFNSIGLSFVDTAVAYDFYRKVTDAGSGTDWKMID